MFTLCLQWVFQRMVLVHVGYAPRIRSNARDHWSWVEGCLQDASWFWAPQLNPGGLQCWRVDVIHDRL